MSPSVGYTWKLRQIMAAHGLWKTSDLGPLLAQRGVTLSTAQVYRLVAKVPERLSMPTLAALCDIFSCTPGELIEIGDLSSGDEADRPTKTVVDLAAVGRPRRARVGPGTE
ncbi:MAG TPA: helix-turn-helix transcriptional regulator [Acidimicrobiales bacterium]|jgi:DNA-binding Xre family transcriptional regulator|nr:helix-turn-helix transcriptional regulator [Acidimicrobiales bacterium]